MFSPVPLPRTRLASLLAVVLLGGFPTAVRAAQPVASAGTAAADGLMAERARLRAELDKVNAEIDALKRAGGVADDYRLRARLADAESLARRLMDIDAKLGARGEAAGAAKPLVAPTANPGDGPADLDAKADILADQSRRLRAQADAFTARARDLKGRQELRRRASDLDRDPFAAMEGPRRRVAVGAGNGAPSNHLDRSSAAPASTGAGATTGSAGVSSPGAGPAPGASIVTPSPTTIGGFTSTTTGSEKTGGNAGQSIDKPGDSLVGGTASLAAQLRDLLDTATLAELRRLEVRAPGSTQALDRAAAALRARAADLDARARAMRERAHPPR